MQMLPLSASTMYEPFKDCLNKNKCLTAIEGCCIVAFARQPTSILGTTE